MLNWALQKLLGTFHEREVKRLRPVVARINAFEPAIQKLTDGELRAKTEEFRRRIADGMKGANFPDPSRPMTCPMACSASCRAAVTGSGAPAASHSPARLCWICGVELFLST